MVRPRYNGQSTEALGHTLKKTCALTLCEGLVYGVALSVVLLVLAMYDACALSILVFYLRMEILFYNCCDGFFIQEANHIYSQSEWNCHSGSFKIFQSVQFTTDEKILLVL